MKNIFFYDTCIGKISIAEEAGFVTNIFFEGHAPENMNVEETPVIKKAYAQLEEYFSGKRESFDLPLNPKGTEFQKKTWNALLEIPYGEICSYKDIALKIDCPKGYRAVGLANNKNPIPVVIPCHRVVGANGKLVGYAGGLNIKKHLLNLES